MERHRFQDLSEGQVACLRLVYQHKSSKEIARELGISKDTVDQRVDRARKLIGASSRVEAARALAEWEAGYHRVVYDAPAIADPSPDPSLLSSANDGERQARSGMAVREAQAPYHASMSPPASMIGLPFPQRPGERNDLSFWQRLIWITLIAVAVPVLLGSLVTGLWALGQIASTLKA